MVMRSTHTIAILQVPQEAYDFISKAFKDAGYDHCFMNDAEGTIDMHQIGIQPIKKPDEATHRREPDADKIVKYSQLKSGQILYPDDNFSCLKLNEACTVKRNDGGFYIECEEGYPHDVQRDYDGDNDTLVGLASKPW